MTIFQSSTDGRATKITWTKNANQKHSRTTDPSLSTRKQFAKDSPLTQLEIGINKYTTLRHRYPP